MASASPATSNKFRRWALAFALTAAALAPAPASALRRVALVVGEAGYQHADRLANTLNDAHAIAALLRRAGFDTVDERDDLGVVDFKRAVRDFTKTADGAEIAVIYYSGHGLEAAGVNYLVPVDARLANAFDVEDETLALDRLLWATAGVKTLSLVILDACRDNPFPQAGGPAGPHRVAPRPPERPDSASNTLVAYAAKGGSVSYDGEGPNSPFATALLRRIAVPGLDIRLALGMVRDDVLAATEGRQEPYVYGSLGGAIVSLAPAAVAPAPPLAAPSVEVAPAPPPVAQDACAREAAQLAALRNDPAPDAVAAFAANAACAALRPQIARLQESAGLATAAPGPTQLATREAPATCDEQKRELERLRAEPDATRAKSLSAKLSCAALRPQLQRLIESLGPAAAP